MEDRQENSSKKCSARTILGGMVLFGLLLAAIAVPTVYSINKAENERKSETATTVLATATNGTISTVITGTTTMATNMTTMAGTTVTTASTTVVTTTTTVASSEFRGH